MTKIKVQTPLKNIRTQEADAFIKEKGNTYKLISFAENKTQSDKIMDAYKGAGFTTLTKKAKGYGYAVYALFKWGRGLIKS